MGRFAPPPLGFLWLIVLPPIRLFSGFLHRFFSGFFFFQDAVSTCVGLPFFFCPHFFLFCNTLCSSSRFSFVDDDAGVFSSFVFFSINSSETFSF